MRDLTVNEGRMPRPVDRPGLNVRTVLVGSRVSTVAGALSTLSEIVARARQAGEPVVKVVHGPDDQRAPLRKALRQMTLNGTIQGFVPGEEWAPFHEQARQLTRKFPGLKRNTEFGRRDPRATIVVVAS